MRRNALHVQNEASNKYNPYTLKSFLTRTEDGTVIVDRSRLIKSEDDERLFYVVLNRDYKWGYSNPKTTTIYFRESGGRIYGGTYEDKTGCSSERIIAVAMSLAKEYDYKPYLYEPPVLLKIIRSIQKT